MSTTVKNGVMVLFGVGGMLTLATIAEFGLPSLLIGTGMSVVSGVMAVNGNGPSTLKGSQASPSAVKRN